MILAKERAATAPSQPPMDEEERHTLPGDFVVHVKAIDAFCRHTVLCHLSGLTSQEMIIVPQQRAGVTRLARRAGLWDNAPGLRYAKCIRPQRRTEYSLYVKKETSN